MYYSSNTQAKVNTVEFSCILEYEAYYILLPLFGTTSELYHVHVLLVEGSRKGPFLAAARGLPNAHLFFSIFTKLYVTESAKTMAPAAWWATYGKHLPHLASIRCTPCARAACVRLSG